MKIGLYNIDSKVPNLALMKISAWHKQQGDTVEFYLPLEKSKYGKVYASQIFTDSKPEYLTPDMELGGSGVDLKKELPKEIDDMKPDYELFSENDYSLGFVTRGCIRNCEFCIVQQKEGKPYLYRPIQEVWAGHKHILLMDNNVLTMPEIFKDVLYFCKTQNITVDFNQGLDCRLATDDILQTIIDYRQAISPEPRFAFDSLDYQDDVVRIINYLPKDRRHRIRWMVYIDENWESALERLLILKRYKQKPYPMRNKRVIGKGFEKWQALYNWSSFQGKYEQMDFYEFMRQDEGLRELDDAKTGQKRLDI